LIKSNFLAYRWEQRRSWCSLRSSAACDLWFRVAAVGVDAVPDASGGPRSSVQLVRRYTGYGGVFRPRSRASPGVAWWRTAPASALQLTEPSSDVNKTKFLRPRPRPNHQNNKTKTTGSKQRHLADLTFRQVNQHLKNGWTKSAEILHVVRHQATPGDARLRGRNTIYNDFIPRRN